MDFHNYLDSRKLFSVPIYFRSQEEHREYFDAKRQRYIDNQMSFYERNGWEFTAENKIRSELDFERWYFHVWKYTEIIGHIEFRKKENSIFAFVWLVEAKRYSPIMKYKKFELKEYFPDYKINIFGKTNKEVSEQIYEVLDQINNSSRRFQRYYIDKSELVNFAHLIDYGSI
jgi:hypothetical protein